MSNDYIYATSGGGGGGDVVGPASSTAGDIAIFADASGKLIADSGVNIADIPIEITGTVQTTDDTPTAAITFPCGATPGTYVFEVRISGFEASTPAGTGFQLFGTVRTTGAAAVLIGVPDKISNTEAALSTADADLSASANNAVIEVTGLAATTIEWKAALTYTFVS